MISEMTTTHFLTPASLIESAIRLERQFSDNQYSGRPDNPPIHSIAGDVPLVVSCPHAVNHPREGATKLADTFTGTLGLQLAQFTGASALVYSRTTLEDPNYDEDGPYKQTLLKYVSLNAPRCVLDLHGLSSSSDFQIVIGTAQGRSIAQRPGLRNSLVRVLQDHGFTRIGVDIPGFYDASRPSTITSFISREAGVPAVQMEIHKDFRDPAAMSQQYVQLVEALVACVHFCVSTF